MTDNKNYIEFNNINVHFEDKYFIVYSLEIPKEMKFKSIFSFTTTDYDNPIGWFWFPKEENEIEQESAFVHVTVRKEDKSLFNVFIVEEDNTTMKAQQNREKYNSICLAAINYLIFRGKIKNQNITGV